MIFVFSVFSVRSNKPGLPECRIILCVLEFCRSKSKRKDSLAIEEEDTVFFWVGAFAGGMERHRRSGANEELGN